MLSSEQFILFLQSIILLVTVIVSAYTFYISHVFTRKNKIQTDSNKLFELDLERAKVLSKIRAVSEHLNYEVKKYANSSNRIEKLNIDKLNTTLNELIILLSGIQLEMKHILLATGVEYKAFTVSQCRLYAECWYKLLNFEKAEIFWKRALKIKETNAYILSGNSKVFAQGHGK